ncbi:MAG: hypothetical protein ACI94Y_004592 [Maribacter sp.]|jgi:hypothetical protein
MSSACFGKPFLDLLKLSFLRYFKKSYIIKNVVILILGSRRKIKNSTSFWGSAVSSLTKSILTVSFS